ERFEDNFYQCPAGSIPLLKQLYYNGFQTVVPSRWDHYNEVERADYQDIYVPIEHFIPLYPILKETLPYIQQLELECTS
ncbi:MAG: hypothetical protein K2X66_03080, partial [Cyanobacteria bacterium]|nr:hypothetical protein [Cyanobacteriota bacterium]